MKRLIMVLAVLMTATALPAQIGAELAARHAVVVVEDSPFAPAIQLLSEADLGMMIAFGTWGVSFGAGVGYLSPSAITGDGIVYRGVVIRSAWLRGTVALDSSFDASASARAALGEYALTPLLFFYPDVRVSLDYHVTRESSVPAVVQIWGGYQFRQDLSVSFMLGVGTRVRLVLDS